ncbi:MAG: adenylosuccinate synthetase, partial [Planctomycetota bacterium]
GVRKLEDLPEAARRYVAFIEDELEVKARVIGVGPERTQAIVVS